MHLNDLLSSQGLWVIGYSLRQLTDLVWYWAEFPGLLIRLKITWSDRRAKHHTHVNIFADPNMINPP